MALNIILLSLVLFALGAVGEYWMLYHFTNWESNQLAIIELASLVFGIGTSFMLVVGFGIKLTLLFALKVILIGIIWGMIMLPALLFICGIGTKNDKKVGKHE